MLVSGVFPKEWRAYLFPSGLAEETVLVAVCRPILKRRRWVAEEPLPRWARCFLRLRFLRLPFL